jgi:hypothetical protein
MYSPCCSNKTTISYSILHNPAPITLTKDEDYIFKFLLWYCPLVKNSNQRFAIYPSTLSWASTLTMNKIATDMGMTFPDDVSFNNNKNAIEKEYKKYYNGKFCKNCQKINCFKASATDELTSFFLHLRNSIAHGLFQKKDNYILFFDKNTNNIYPNTAIIKIMEKSFIKTMLEFLNVHLDKPLQSRISRSSDNINFGYKAEMLAKELFSKMGYNIIDQKQIINNFKPDFIVEKNNQKYVVEVKMGNKRIKNFKRFIKNELIKPFKEKGYKFILFHFQRIIDEEDKLLISEYRKDRIMVWDKTTLKRMQTLAFKNKKLN